MLIYREIIVGRLWTLMKKLSLVLILVLSFVLAGCGKDEKLEKYYKEMSAFTTRVTNIKNRMDTVDTTDSHNKYELLGYLDDLEDQFEYLASMEVPSQFASNEDLADEAYTYMQEAVRLYHQYYENPSVDDNVFEAATENYERSMLRLEYISTLLKGETPEGENIEVTNDEVTDFDPVTEDYDE